MAANPALVRALDGSLIPAPFPNEFLMLRRDNVTLRLDSLATASGKWHTDGTLFLSNFRLVFIASKPDPSGLAAFDFPLVYIHSDAINQPIFGCNNLSGKVWPVAEGPPGSHPPHTFKLEFKRGGIGTLYPLYYMLKQRAAAELAAARTPHQEGKQATFESFAQSAFVDPSDPTQVYLTQPVDEAARLREVPKFAANYGKDEKYEGMGLRP